MVRNNQGPALGSPTNLSFFEKYPEVLKSVQNDSVSISITVFILKVLRNLQNQDTKSTFIKAAQSAGALNHVAAIPWGRKEEYLDALKKESSEPKAKCKILNLL